MFTDSLNPAPLEALAGRLQGGLYRADMLQQECEALLVDFPTRKSYGVIDVDSGGGKVTR